MNVKKAFFSGLLFAAFGLQTAAAENLLEIYLLSLDNDPQFRAAESSYQAALQAKPQAVAALLPQIDAFGTFSFTDEKITGDFFGQQNITSTETYTSNQYGIRLNQAIFRLDRILELGRADASIAQAKATREAAGLDLTIRVSEAYFNVLGAQDNIDFAKAEKEAVSRQLDQASLQFDVGMVAVTDVKEAQASYDLAVADEILAENALDVAFEVLRSITGSRQAGLSSLARDLPLTPPEPADIDQWVEIAVQKNLPLLAARFESEAAQKTIGIQRSGHAPTLDLDFTSSEQNIDGGLSGGRESTNTIAMLELNIPVFRGGQTVSLTREAQALFHRSQEIQELRKREAVQQTRTSYGNVLSGISRVKALEQAVESTNSSADSAQAGFEVGTRTSVDVLISLRDSFRAKRDLARARYDYIVDSLRLKQATGDLGATDIEAMNAWLK